MLNKFATALEVGDVVHVRLGGSEVIAHMGLTDKYAWVEILDNGAQLYIDGRPHSFPVTHGEAGIYRDGSQLYTYVDDGMSDLMPRSRWVVEGGKVSGLLREEGGTETYCGKTSNRPAEFSTANRKAPNFCEQHCIKCTAKYREEHNGRFPITY